ncbi:hypothetical protein [Tropicibacter sp. S64]|uniref:hypothetical protein n=1 Tax=Tropicibacter sp. S64 TaxID=3415122 RepID=UPI003C7E2470
MSERRKDGHAQGRGFAFGAALAVLLPVMAQAGDVFVAPEGCTLDLTTQNRDCRVEHSWHCPQIDADDVWRVVIDETGPVFVSRIDNQTQWVESGPPHDPAQWITQRPIADASNLDELLAGGLDTYDFSQRRPGGMIERITGFDRIVGEVVIDGETLYQTEFYATYRDWQGTVLRELEGREFVSGKHRRFFPGYVKEILPDGRETEWSRPPVEFIYPGEAGFAAMQPLYDCDVISALRTGAVFG